MTREVLIRRCLACGTPYDTIIDEGLCMQPEECAICKSTHPFLCNGKATADIVYNRRVHYKIGVI